MAVQSFKPSGTELEVSHERTERLYVKLGVGGLLGLMFLIALIWGGHRGYVWWQEKQLVRSAVRALEQGDDATAGLALRAVLQLKPSSTLAGRLLAELAEKSGDRSAPDWRRKVVDLEPNSVEDILAWARSAVQFGDLSTAGRALGMIDEKGRQRADYHAARALLAEARHDDELADSEWAKAIELDPQEKGYQLHLGILRTRANDLDRHASGKAMLALLRSDPKQRAAATRTLINDGVNRRDSAQQLLELARELQAYPEAAFSDRLLYLHFLHQIDDQQFTRYLTDLESRVATRPVDLGALINWMSENNLNLLALDFAKGLPPEILHSWPVPAALAEIYTQLKDWTKLEGTAKAGSWEQFDFLRHAYLTRALRAQDKSAAAEREWAEAVKLAASQSGSLFSLARLASEWNWDKEALDLLWVLSKNAETQAEALNTLYSCYTKLKDAQGLYRVLVRWAELAPDDLNIQNNFAQISLLLGVNPNKARDIAAAVYRKAPWNPPYAATYAYSLLTNGKSEEAVKVMSSLTDEQLRDPAIRAYYGICLAAVHDDKARQFLEAGKQSSFLPEEKRLIEKALASLGPEQLQK